MRRKDREKDEAFALAVADKCAYATVAVTMPGGTPYCVPLSIARVGRTIYFHSAREGQKLEALRGDPRVCICCVGDVAPIRHEFSTAYESAIICGTAAEVCDAEEKREAFAALCLRYNPEHMDAFEAEMAKYAAAASVWRVDIEGITGKMHEAKKM